MQHHEDEEHVSKKNTENNVLNTALFWSEQGETLLTLWTKTPQEIPFWSFRFQFPVGHSKDILPFDLGFCCAANRVKALAWVEQMQWHQPFQGEHAVCFSGVDAEMHDPQHIPQSEAKKFPTCFFLIEGWPRNCQALMAGKERPERSSIALHHQGNKATRTITKLPIRNSWTIVISWYWICDIRYMIYDVWYMMWLYYLYDIWYVMHMLICSSPTITLCCSHLRWVGMPDMGRLGFSRWVTSKKSFNFFWISPWFTHHETKKWSK